MPRVKRKFGKLSPKEKRRSEKIEYSIGVVCSALTFFSLNFYFIGISTVVIIVFIYFRLKKKFQIYITEYEVQGVKLQLKYMKNNQKFEVSASLSDVYTEFGSNFLTGFGGRGSSVDVLFIEIDRLKLNQYNIGRWSSVKMIEFEELVHKSKKS